MDEIRAAAARLRGSAFRFGHERDLLPPAAPLRPSRGPVSRLSGRVLRRLTHQESEGVADFPGRRSMRDLGHYAVLRLGDEEWSGRSGRPLSTLPAGAPGADQPLWLVEALAAAVTATTAATGRLLVTASLEGIDLWNAPPPAALAARPELEVLLGPGGALQRIRWSDGAAAQSLTVLEAGVDAEALDWTRLPAFRTPG